MVQTKRPPVIKWNPYKENETRELIMKEIRQLAAKKEIRRKKGLETGVLREFKGNTHWNLYMAIEIAEIITHRLNNDIRNLFLQTSQGMSNTSNYLGNIAQQLKKAEYDLNNVTTLSSNNTIKTIQTEISKLNKALNNVTTIQTELKSSAEKIQTDLNEASNLLKETITENYQNVLKELCDRNEASQIVITEDIHKLQDLVKVNFGEFNDKLTELEDKNSKATEELSDKIVNVGSDLTKTDEKLTTFQETTNNMFDEQQNVLISEFQEGVGGLMKQNLDNFGKTEKSLISQKDNIIKRLDESTEDLTSIMEATNEHLEKINNNIDESIKHSEDSIVKEMRDEVTDLRAILSTIRSDIELMKSVLTKVDSKIH
jgi:hypothetical protein